MASNPAGGMRPGWHLLETAGCTGFRSRTRTSRGRFGRGGLDGLSLAQDPFDGGEGERGDDERRNDQHRREVEDPVQGAEKDPGGSSRKEPGLFAKTQRVGDGERSAKQHRGYEEAARREGDLHGAPTFFQTGPRTM